MAELAALGRWAIFVAADVTERAAVDAMVEQVEEELRLLTPREVGDACVALASDEARAMTGAVDGGYAVTKSLGGSPFMR